MEAAWQMWILYLLSAVLGICLLGFLVLNVYLFFAHQKAAHIPMPPMASFYFGHVPSMQEAGRDSCAHLLFHKWAKEYGQVYRLFFFHQCFIAVTSKEVVKEVLTRSIYPKPALFQEGLGKAFGERFLGTGLLTNTNNQAWAKRRAALNPFFHRRCLQMFMSVFNAKADDLLMKLASMADGETMINMANFLSRFALDVIGKVGFGYDIGSMENDKNRFPAAVTLSMEGVFLQNREISLKLNPSQWSYRKEVRKACRLIRSEGRRLLEERAKDMKEGKEATNDLLTGLLREFETDSSFDMEDVLDDFATLFIAGHETTANTLAFCLLELGRHPDVYQRLVQEVDAVLEGSSDVENKHLSQLTYMTQVLKETLRLYPIAPGTLREITKDTVIQGIPFPKGTIAMISSYSMHRSPKYFEDPETFNPDRFSPGADIPLFSYMPFSIGQRSCAGQQFAMHEAKVLLCKFLSTYGFELDTTQGIEVVEKVTLRPKGGCWMKLTPRT